MILWQAYLKQFSDKYDLLKNDLLEDGHEEIGPYLGAKDRRYPKSAPFGMDWAVIYPDGNYFRVKEAYDRLGAPIPGAGRRATFSFHYGRANSARDSEGFPIIRSGGTPPADLRIDMHPPLGPHIHLITEDHIPQNRVRGYSINSADVFQFLQGVIEHRKSHKPLHELLGIQVI